MKKLLVFLLSLTLILSFTACGNESDDVSSNTPFSKAESSAASSNQESSEAISSEEESSEESSVEEGPTAPAFINNFLSIGAVDTKVNSTSANAIRLTGIDVAPDYGAIVLYTPEYGLFTDEDFSEFAVAIFEYSQTYFGYVKTAFYKVGEAQEIEIPDDGFVVAAHSFQNLYIGRLENLSNTETIFPHGLHLYTGSDYTVKKAETAPSIDGVFSENEWSEFFVENVNAENPSWSYAQFEVNNYYSTASYYVAYDDEYLYLCVVVDSPYHYCPITQDTAGDMWQYECIQVKVSSEAPNGEYILENYDHISDRDAVTDGIVRSYGFAANDNGDTCYYESGVVTEFGGLVSCSRDDANQTTVYEVAISFAEFEITPEQGLEMGLTFSINSTNESDVGSNIWKNITYRNGGGVIGRNDWSKIPVITLG